MPPYYEKKPETNLGPRPQLAQTRTDSSGAELRDPHVGSVEP